MSKTIPLCECGSCNDAHAAALKLYQQMLDSGDCTLWINAVTTNLVIMSRMGVTAKCMEIVKEHGEDVILGIDHAKAVCTDIHERVANLSNHGEKERMATAQIVCEHYGEAIRAMAEEKLPERPAEPNIVEMLEEIFGKGSVFTADSLGITKPH